MCSIDLNSHAGCNWRCYTSLRKIGAETLSNCIEGSKLYKYCVFLYSSYMCMAPDTGVSCVTVYVITDHLLFSLDG